MGESSGRRRLNLKVAKKTNKKKKKKGKKSKKVGREKKAAIVFVWGFKSSSDQNSVKYWKIPESIIYFHIDPIKELKQILEKRVS